MLQRESKTVAVKKKTDRSKKVVEDIPPTTPGKRAHIQLFDLQRHVVYRLQRDLYISPPTQLPAEGRSALFCAYPKSEIF